MPCSLGVSSYAHIALLEQRYDLHFFHGNIPTGQSASLYANPILRKILLSTGNIPVVRKSNDRQALFRGTIEALSHGAAVALFPEGTSYTEPRIMQVKDGAAWAALEYSKWAQENPDRASDKPLVIVPCAIVYTNKSKYRSNVRPFGVFIN
jgi:glycerol-3-phosphate O-acyltransferase/dihydroxyacetone phosphate acyltransferase